ncbi:MAG: 3-oxoacyl-[acyl-carrier-protein] reductase [Tenericutes bacterium GWC2_34_14]|nr:MAG: 3-oxoacyl-[acyl-carrier-protein] reductase [Tenericutes bacterium GWA2_35_7]OHE28284.1 MAG: 3-oxoacyl-[acyl-carrier-protein] reductase [Tenericutes bacterium GWC2_34_14]OHE33089.1 MAG: 3-oxoacyl-[acyl-carrier-protein] reductase [Tenericutes bacterium GWE2_34_108]OHE36209.1 MAG: 3-oxoacyl-[acyl-carrier-protein] reductase [Tenericutes bacterium GWF1_35_14]OHE38748.1 MAG: 3-oxoacyl-[acyl-carrier-protein] reductase [Tenericutes bacterium GWF2_35_184]OHE44751.1 MAG: 3-oxoacyl-[acyl-carrier-
MDLSNKIALVTGGASGIGRTISLELAKRGATVVVNYNRSRDAADSLIKEIEAMHGQALAIQADVSKYEDAGRLIETIISQYGTLNIVVNNAGITDDALILRMSEEQFSRVIDTNLKGVWNVSKHSAKVLLKSGYGRLINISSISGVLGNAGQSNYSAAKAGVIGMTKALAREFAGRNVTVNAIAPGFIETEMTKKLPEDAVKAWANQIPLKRFGQPEDVAYAVVFLASEQASYITGHTLEVDGGLVM